MVTITNLGVTTNNQILLNNISCTLTPGRITSFIGPSGAGKTTLLKSMVGLIPLQSGEIFVNNQSLASMSNHERAKNIGYLFQDFNLFPCMTVVQNCIDPLLIRGVSWQEAQSIACSLLKKLGLEEHLQKYPAELSGGQKQRVALARMLALKPSIILLDEPTASLDPKNSAILKNILQELIREGLTIGLSTQDMDFARSIMDRVYYVERGTVQEFCDLRTNSTEKCPLIHSFLNL